MDLALCVIGNLDSGVTAPAVEEEEDDGVAGNDGLVATGRCNTRTRVSKD